jgi:hypothetical protein
MESGSRAWQRCAVLQFGETFNKTFNVFFNNREGVGFPF